MNHLDDIKSDLTQKFQKLNGFNFTNQFGNDAIDVPKEAVLPLMRHLKGSGRFDFLMDLCGNDFPSREKRFEVVYQLFDTKTFKRLRVKTQVGENEAVDSIVSVWKGANWFEREAYDMFGIIFKGHPYLRKILTHHHFKGHPLRKDYDPNHQQHCSDVLPAFFEDDDTHIIDPNKNLVQLNIGPSHPATHGTLRVMVELEGETINRSNVELGFLHRCFEKMCETHYYNQVITYTDRLNYCSAPMNNMGYCKAIEKMLGVEIPPKAQATRIILAELSRIIDHIVCIGANAVDLGALTGFFYLFALRERVYTVFEKLCGARLTVSLLRIGGIANEPPKGWFEEILKVNEEIKKGIEEIDRLLTNNKIWIQRTKGVGGISIENAIQYGYTGPCMRATGLGIDLRKVDPYYGYDQLDFDIPTGTTGDVYDRYLVRMEEMRQSTRIIDQLAKNVPAGDYTIRDKDIVLPMKKDVYGNIEGLMNHFMLIIKGIKPPPGEIYDATEAANGELGFYCISDGGPKPYRMRARPPCFAIYQSFSELINKGLVADVVSVLGSLNLIAGELDR